MRTSVHLLLFLLIKFCPLLVLSQSTPDQTTTMKEFYNLVNTSLWKRSNESNPCSWDGVNCSNSLVVRGISLSGFGLSSSEFLRVMCKIESLELIDVSNNQLRSIPDEFIDSCGGIGSLKLLNFSKNKIGVLPNFNGFLGLGILDLSFNSLHGNVSSQLTGLVSLKSLNLSSNRLTGSVPVGNSFLLEELNLCSNRFSGEIPDRIGNYHNMRFVDLSMNQLSGSVPVSVGNLTKLRILILSSNNLTGGIPASISNISSLYRFAANQNEFTGSIPGGITQFLSILDLSYNKLSGTIPRDFFLSVKLSHVDLSNNLLNGSVPENMSGSLVRLRLGNNSLTGRIPSSFSVLKRLMYLELDKNSLSGKIPSELGDCQSLALLNLAENSLIDVIPESLGNLNSLQVMEFQSNKLSGQIPERITQLPRLMILNFSSNLLNGSIPSTLNLPKLTHLNLQGNYLSGSIPANISTLDSLIELQLGQNQLTGLIPSMPLRLQIALNLSGNHFQGEIPSSLSRLSDLEILDLSNNNFSGQIPNSLTQLLSLTELVLSNNRLHGLIPDFKSYVIIKATGNADLVLQRKPNTSPGTKTKTKSVAVIVVVALAVVVLTIGVVMIVLRLVSRQFPKVIDQLSQSAEDAPQVIQGNLLTTNSFHRSNIDFSGAMEVVADPLNIVVKTRFSTYYEATVPSGETYFIKKLDWSDKLFQLGSHAKFNEELGTLGKISNSNVMTPLAYVLTANSAFLFYEYAERGTLFDVLHGTSPYDLDWSSRYSIAVGIAQGLAYLHGYTAGPILLLDLSSRNIFLKSLTQPQIGDIELCKVIDPTKSTGSLSTVAGSIGYIPPEYAYTMRITMPGNVYSFGVILLELLTGKSAVSDGIELAKWVQTMPREKWNHILDSTISRNSFTVQTQMLAVLKVAVNCVNISPESRPKMKSALRLILHAR